MMESIRRRFKSGGKDLWATDLVLEPEVSEASEMFTDHTSLPHTKAHSPSNDVDMRDYYKGLILTAIDHGGEYQGHQISIPWLRMTLAGLEMRPMPPEMMWQGEPEEAIADMGRYDTLFPDQTGTQ